MKRRVHRTIIITISLLFWVLSSPCFAQDKGQPAMKTVSLYTMGGAAAGIGLGLLYWAIDPLRPGTDIKESVLQGMGIGAIAGGILSIVQLQRQIVLPQSDSNYNSEFGYLQTSKKSFRANATATTLSLPVEKIKKPLGASIVNYQWTF